MNSYPAKETAVFVALVLLLMATFQDHIIVIGGMFLIGVLALDDLSETAFLQAMLDDTIKRTTTEPVIYIIGPSCKFKLLVWRQAHFMRPVHESDHGR